jgi:hypothetical protein
MTDGGRIITIGSCVGERILYRCDRLAVDHPRSAALQACSTTGNRVALALSRPSILLQNHDVVSDDTQEQLP